MKYLKTFENLTTERDFDKAVYSPEDKSIIAPYMIILNNDMSLGVLNIKEIQSTKAVFLDNAIGYDITIHRVNLDKSKIEILEDVPGKEGFKYIKIPYYLYKSNLNDLEIKRAKGGFDGEKYRKRLDIPAIKTERKTFISEFEDINVVNYIKITNPDTRTHFLVDSYHNKK